MDNHKLLGSKLENQDIIPITSKYDDMTLVDKILACHGHLIPKSIAIVCDCHLIYVYYVLRVFCIKPMKANYRRTKKYHLSQVDFD